MTKFRKSAFSGTTCLQTAAFAAALISFSATAAQAQNAPADDSAQCEGAACDDGKSAIVVTGSRIARPNLESQVPIASIGGEEFQRQADNNVGDALNDLPQLRSTFSQQNPGLGIGIAGLNLLDLRGLGTARTLVLVNGRRHVPADILNNAVSPDVNSIPNDLIDRVDIVTGGNSAVYGSDAIAGVVNFVLKKSFDGVQIRGSGGISGAGFGGNAYVSAMAGKNFNDGAGNITIHGEHAHQTRVFASDIPWFTRQDGFGIVDVDSGGLPQNSDGINDRQFFTDFRSASINRFGLIPITNNISGSAPCGRGLVGSNGLPSSTGALPFNCTYVFDEAGNLAVQTGTRFGSSSLIGSIIGGNGQTGREARLLSVMPQQDRYNFNMLAHYTFSDAFEWFFEGKYNKVITQGSNAGPSFIQGTFSQFDLRERVRLDNPFLTAAQRTTIANAILASGCNPSLTGSCNVSRSSFSGQGISGPLNAADIAAIGAGTYRFVIARHLADSGIRDERFNRTTWRVVTGARGTFNDDWNYELSFNYGKFVEKTRTYGYVDRQRFMLAMDAGLDPADNKIKCRSQFDPSAAVAFPSNATNLARLAADIAACVPYNPFGGKDNSASANYFVYNANHEASINQLVLNGFVSGDTSGFLNLQGGPVRFAVGGEYRREKAAYIQDPFVQGGFTNAVVIPTFTPPAFEVKEAFGEVQVPLFSDMPFLHELTLSGAARVAKYQGGTGTVWAYNGGGEWSPMEGLRFRTNYARAVRAPNVSETGFPLVPNFAPGFSDPCNAANIGAGSTFRAANCTTALGANLATVPATTYSLGIVSGSNPNLQAETSDSWTIGGVVQPAFIPGLSVSVDYYNIKVNGIIASIAAQTIVNNCYDQPTLANVFCSAFQRWSGPGLGPNSEQPGQILNNSLIAAPLNFAKRIRRGIDTQVTYRHSFDNGIKVYSNLIYTHNFAISNFQDPTNANFENRVLGELGDPVDEFRWDTDVTVGKFTVGYRMHFIGSMYVNNYEDFNPLQDRGPQDSDWADVQKFPSVFYHDVRLEVNLDDSGFAKDFNWFIGVNNVLNTKPPLGSTATGVGSAIYEFRGRNFNTGFRARF